jgi:excisionase family DNA binding protein
METRSVARNKRNVLPDRLTLSQHAVNVSAVPPDTPETPTSNYPEILTTAMAAEMLHVHVEYLRKMVREDRIPAHRFPGGREIRFLRDELIAWVREQPGEDRSPSRAESNTRD